MSLSFQHTVSALCYSIIYQRCQPCQPIESALAFPHNDVVAFVLQQHSRMPDYFRFPIVALTLVFDLWGVLRVGAPFHQLAHEVRWRQIQSWQNSPIGACRDLMRLYESLTIFCWYSSIPSPLAFTREVEWLKP